MSEASTDPTAGPSDLVWLGALLAVCGQFIGASSMLLMKRASVLEADRPFFRRPIFQVAFALFFFNTVVLDAVIYALAPLTIVAPITALGVVFVNIGVAMGLFVQREPLVQWASWQTPHCRWHWGCKRVWAALEHDPVHR